MHLHTIPLPERSPMSSSYSHTKKMTTKLPLALQQRLVVRQNHYPLSHTTDKNKSEDQTP